MNKMTLLAAASLLSAGASAQLSLTALGTPVSQDFNTLPSAGTAVWTNNVTAAGVFYARTGTGLNIAADTGSSNGGNLYSYGAAANADRALGSIGSGNATAGNFFYGIRLQNNTGSTITSLAVSYVGEQWRNGGAATPTVQSLTFSYLVGAPTVVGNLAEFQMAGTPIPALNFSSPINNVTAATLDGNTAGNRTAIASTIAGLSIPNGSEIMLRWSDPDHTGSDHGLSIDDFSVTGLNCVAAPVVTTTADSGAGSLRAAIAGACPGANITFDAGTFATPQTITLTSGQLSVGANLTLTGPGASLLTLSGNNASRILEVTGGIVVVSGLRFTAGNSAPSGVGGAIGHFGGTLTVNDAVVTGNSCLTVGGGIGSENGNGLTLNRVVVSNNSCPAGSAMFLSAATINDSLISDHTTGSAVFVGSGGVLNLNNSTISNNTTSTDATAIIGNSTPGQTVTVRLFNSTVTNNQSSTANPAIRLIGAGTNDLLLTNSIVVGNTGNGVPNDIDGTANVSSSFNLVGVGGGLVNGVNNNQVGVSPAAALLASLGNYGGPTLTHALLPGSPAIDAATTMGAPLTDQRGINRIGSFDIGAFESRGFNAFVFSGNNQSTDVNTGFAMPLRVEVQAIAPGEPVEGGQISFTPPMAGASATVATSPASIINGVAAVNATANGTAGGPYFVGFNARGVSEPGSFGLTNLPGGVATVFTIADASLVEGNATPANMQFTVTATPAPTASTTVNFASTSGTAASGIDFTASNGTLTFGIGVATQVINVPITGDLTVEANETLTVTLSNPSAGTVGVPGSATGTITNDDSAVISLSAPSVAEGNLGTTPLPFVLSISNPVQGAVSLDYASADGNNVDPLLNATIADNDFAATTGTVSFPSDSTTNLTVNVTVNGDTKVEANQGLRLNLSNLVRPAGIDPAALTLAATSGDGTINNDDGTTVSVAPASVTEGNAGTSNLVFNLSLSNPSKTPVSVDFATAGVTATSGTDFNATGSTLTFQPGNQSLTVMILVNGELIVEANETLSLTLSNPVGALLGSASATGTINNDDSATLSLNSVNQAEGNTGNSPMNFTATLSAPVQGTVTASASTADGNNANPLLNATVADNDYVALSNAPVSIATGTTAMIPVQIVGDTDVEPNQGLRLTLSNLVAPAGIPAGAITLGTATGAGTINNDDGTTMNIASNGIVEGNAGTSVLNFTVSLTAPNKDPVTVNFATANGTATAGSDYMANSGVLTFPANTQSQTVAVTVNGDTLLETDETFTITLSGANGATLGTAVATGTITNDDTAALSVADASTPEGSTNTGVNQLSFVVTLMGSSASPITVNFATSNGSATAVLDYTATSGTLIFAPGETSKTVNVPVAPDMLQEASETLTFTLSNPTPAQVTLTRATATGTINNDDFVSQIPVNNRLALAMLLLLIGGLGLVVMRRR